MSPTTWRHVADQLEQATVGADVVDVAAVALRMVLMLEHVECRPR